jgi:hypothetical protein
MAGDIHPALSFGEKYGAKDSKTFTQHGRVTRNRITERIFDRYRHYLRGYAYRHRTRWRQNCDTSYTTNYINSFIPIIIPIHIRDYQLFSFSYMSIFISIGLARA